jgi:hypothetical protein
MGGDYPTNNTVKACAINDENQQQHRLFPPLNRSAHVINYSLMAGQVAERINGLSIRPDFKV